MRVFGFSLCLEPELNMTRVRFWSTTFLSIKAPHVDLQSISLLSVR